MMATCKAVLSTCTSEKRKKRKTVSVGQLPKTVLPVVSNMNVTVFGFSCSENLQLVGLFLFFFLLFSWSLRAHMMGFSLLFVLFSSVSRGYLTLLESFVQCNMCATPFLSSLILKQKPKARHYFISPLLFVLGIRKRDSYCIGSSRLSGV